MQSRRKGIIGGLAAAVILSFLAFALLLAVPAPAQAVSFPDVGEADWFAEAVQVLSDAGIVQGSADGSFRPYDSITRAEFAVLVSRSLDLSPGVSHPFTDFPSGAWFEPEAGGCPGSAATDCWFGHMSEARAFTTAPRLLQSPLCCNSPSSPPRTSSASR